LTTLALAAVPVVARRTAGERTSESHGSYGIIALLPTTGPGCARADSSKVLTLQLGNRARITYCFVGTGCEGREGEVGPQRETELEAAPPRPPLIKARPGKARRGILQHARRAWQHGSSQQPAAASFTEVRSRV